jgi:hypothetical protein
MQLASFAATSVSRSEANAWWQCVQGLFQQPFRFGNTCVRYFSGFGGIARFHMQASLKKHRCYRMSLKNPTTVLFGVLAIGLGILMFENTLWWLASPSAAFKFCFGMYWQNLTDAWCIDRRLNTVPPLVFLND